MQKRFEAEGRLSLLLCLIILGLITAVIAVPYRFGAAAVQEDLVVRTKSNDDSLPYYDIRSAARSKEGQTASNLLASWRDHSGENAVSVADIRDSFVRGEEQLRSRVPNLKVEYNDDIRTPEVIGPDMKLG